MLFYSSNSLFLFKSFPIADRGINVYSDYFSLHINPEKHILFYT